MTVTTKITAAMVEIAANISGIWWYKMWEKNPFESFHTLFEENVCPRHGKPERNRKGRVAASKDWIRV